MTAALLALWNSIDQPQARAEYEAWHALEHVPERVGLPGFVAAQRYVGDSGYFTLYTLESLAALQTPAYADVIAHPTPWSARMRPRLSAFVRRPCEVVGQYGEVHAAALTTLRAQTRDLAQWTQQAQVLAQQAVRTGQWARITLAVVPPSYALAYPVGGERIQALADDEVTVLCLLAHWDGRAASFAAPEWQLAMQGLQHDVVQQHFTLQSQVERRDLALPAQGRIPPRLALMAHYQPR